MQEEPVCPSAPLLPSGAAREEQLAGWTQWGFWQPQKLPSTQGNQPHSLQGTGGVGGREESEVGCTLLISLLTTWGTLGSSSLHFPQIELVHVAGGKPCL